MLTVPIVCGLAVLGGFIWRRLVVPFDRMLKFADEQREADFDTLARGNTDSGSVGGAPEATTESLARLHTALSPAATAHQDALPVSTAMHKDL